VGGGVWSDGFWVGGRRNRTLLDDNIREIKIKKKP